MALRVWLAVWGWGGCVTESLAAILFRDCITGCIPFLEQGGQLSPERPAGRAFEIDHGNFMDDSTQDFSLQSDSSDFI